MWTGADRDAAAKSSSTARSRCWPFVLGAVGLFRLWLLSISERWRVDVFFTMLRSAWCGCSAQRARRDLGSVYFFLVLPVASFILLTGWQE